MTIIAAVKKNNLTWMMADSLVAWGWTIRTDRDVTKLVRFKNAFIGCAGSGVFGHMLRYCADKKRDMYDAVFKTEMDVADFFHEFQIFAKDRYSLGSSNSNEISKLGDTSFMLVTVDKIFEISSERSVSCFNNYATIGSAHEIALGAIHVLYSRVKRPADILTETFHTVCRFNMGCGGKIELRNVSKELLNAGRSRRRTSSAADEEVVRL